MNADGTNQVRLTNHAGIDDYPAWSPDGLRIAFLCEDASGGFHINVMNADGSDQTEVTPVAEPSNVFTWELSWSPDGGKLVFAENDDIFVVNIDGKGRRNLTNNPAYDDEPSWSPDGRKIVFVSSRDPYLTMHVMDADGGNVQPLPSDGEFWDMEPDWSPDSSRIAFIVDSETDLPKIYTANADGTSRELFDRAGPGGEHRERPKWSPDGHQLIFQIWDYFTQDAEIYVKSFGGSSLKKLTNTPGSNTNPSWQPINPRAFDFDGDGRSDISVFRPSDRTWYLNRPTAGFSAVQFGLSTDKIPPADLDGDGITDIAVFRDGVWYWLNSSSGTLGVEQFGAAGDVPVPGDYDGGGRDELAVYRSGVWWTLNLTTRQVSASAFGLAADQPVPADYDGDGKVDQAVYRDGEWHLNRSSLGYMVVNFGLANDKPLPADYDGDGKSDPTVYRDGTWYLDRSSQGVAAIQWGLATDTPTPADYDGDGKADLAVFRSGVWYLLQSSDGMSIQQFGLANDIPVPAAQIQIH